MILPKIYKRTSSGKIQEWEIEVEGNQFRTISGQQDGKKVVSKWTVCKGKNEGKANATTAEEQALREAEAKRRLKLEAEYTETIEGIDSVVWQEPMLAKDYKENLDKVSFPIYVQPKLDGMRCVVTRDGMFSRNGKPIISAPHIRAALEPIFAEHPELEFDGELYNHGLKADFDTLISLVKQAKPTEEDLSQSALMIQYWVYDLRIAGETFVDRFELLKQLVKAINEDPRIVVVETKVCDSQAEMDLWYEQWREEGYEGQMVRLRGKGYEFKRTVNLLKRKEFIDEEFTIIDIEEGKGNRSGMAGRMVFMIDGKKFESNIKCSHKMCENLLKNKHIYIGLEATVRYQNLTPKGIPRFPEVIMIDRKSFE